MSISCIKQYIFTNFGVGIKDDIWLAYRIELLINVTAASLLFQSHKVFTWCIFIDEDLPYIYKARLFDLAAKSEMPLVLVCPVQGYSEIQNAIALILKESSIDEPILTTRIDDDDALNIKAIEQIQKSAMKSISSNEEIALIALTNGFEWLPSEQAFRKVSYDSLALGLTLLSRRSAKVHSITQLAHHSALTTLQTLQPKATYIPIDIDGAGYLYTKHPLSDSYYIGSRARILQDANTFGVDGVELRIFGLNLVVINYLKQVFSESPFGMPHKYLAKLGELRNELKLRQLIDHPDSASNNDQSILLAKIDWYQKNATRKNPSLKNKKTRLAIIGSCVSRDLFAQRPELLEKFELVCYLARQSVISYTSSPCYEPSVRNRISDTGFEDRRAQWDMDKSHWDVLEAARPDVIMIDFIDERIGLIFHNGSIVTPSGPIIKAFDKSNTLYEVVRPWDKRTKKLREWAVREFLIRCYSIADNIIIQKAGWAQEYIDGEKEIKSFLDTKYKTLVGLNSTILDDIFRSASMSDIPHEVIGGGELMRGGGGHLWSFCPYHYDDAYYKQLSKDLMRRV
jgi:hypothetical protein